MRNRWLPVGVLAGVLFGINVVARLVGRFAFDDDLSAQDTVSTVMFIAIGLITAVLAFRWGRSRPLDSWSGDLVAIVTTAMLLTVLVGPFISGDSPFMNGAGAFFAQIWLYLGFTVGGAILGYLVLMVLGWDYRSQSLKRYEENRLAAARPTRNRRTTIRH
ncbi:TRAP-type C4-dicarboxylate transport system permease small subunit [Catenuloplanes nepalensis]|uniref:TRAP-type C4-dicarboxylate transport system permease small subunit n=1 Tax=Catenuloplanes nepalensis TaxID=587533 RepID=A0ABT9N1X8_9ACTN|nr:hypothetical protein [Catenuloplanes nepalensis]MDP9797699.1 TRAP-type C4-dicarboxylate transport system permease small subunit [Catenuloplanes nepalensis]